MQKMEPDSSDTVSKSRELLGHLKADNTTT